MSYDDFCSAAQHHDGALAGRSTSGNYGFRLERSLALAMLRSDLAVPGTKFEIEVLGGRYEATVLVDSPHDPENERLRS